MLRSLSTSSDRVSPRRESAASRSERRFSTLSLGRRRSLLDLARPPRLIKQRVGSLVNFNSGSKLKESDERIVQLVGLYLHDLDYPQNLSRKVLKKVRRHLRKTGDCESIERKGSVSAKTPAERSHAVAEENGMIQKTMTLHKPKEYEDGGALENEIFSVLPEKCRADCQWFLYHEHLVQCEFFQQLLLLDKASSKNNAKITYLRGLTFSFSREHLAPGQYLSLVPRGGLYVVRRGACRLRNKGKLEFIAQTGCVFEVSVLVNDHSSVYRPGEKRKVFNVQNLSICAVAPRPSDKFAYGCELGLLTRDDFETFLSASTGRRKLQESESEGERLKSVDEEMVEEQLVNLRDSVAKQISREVAAQERAELKTRIRLESESRIAASKELSEACLDGSLTRIQNALASGADIEYASEPLNQRAIHLCTQKGEPGLMKYLIQNNCSVSAQDAQGKSPLHIAAELTSSNSFASEIARLLLDCGADLSCKDANGNTPLHIAAARGELGMLKVFRDFTSGEVESDTRYMCLTNTAGQTPVDVCREQQTKRALKPKTSLGGGSR